MLVTIRTGRRLVIGASVNDEPAKAEGPSTDAMSIPENGRPRLVVKHVVLDGEDALALAERQWTAIRAVLEYLLDSHSAPPERGRP